MRVGDVSCHHGWTLHMAPEQPPGTPRRAALAISYFADGARVHGWAGDGSLRPGMRHAEDLESYEGWLQDVGDGEPAVHEQLELLRCSPGTFVGD
jgi:hypothetical protein